MRFYFPLAQVTVRCIPLRSEIKDLTHVARLVNYHFFVNFTSLHLFNARVSILWVFSNHLALHFLCQLLNYNSISTSNHCPASTMEPVSIALLAALLPTCIIIFILILLSIFLYRGRNQFRDENVVTEHPTTPDPNFRDENVVTEHPTTPTSAELKDFFERLRCQPQEELEEEQIEKVLLKRSRQQQEEQSTIPEKQNFSSQPRSSHLTLPEVFDKEATQGMRGFVLGSTVALGFEEDENRIRNIFERLQYNGGISPAAFCRHLMDYHLHFNVILHVFNWVCFAWTTTSLEDLKSQPQSAPHRFSVETVTALEAYRKITRGLSCKFVF